MLNLLYLYRLEFYQRENEKNKRNNVESKYFHKFIPTIVR